MTLKLRVQDFGCEICTQLGNAAKRKGLSSVVVLCQFIVVITDETFQLKLLGISYLAVACIWCRTSMAVRQSRAIEPALGIGRLAIGRRIGVVGVEAKEHVHDCNRC